MRDFRIENGNIGKNNYKALKISLIAFGAAAFIAGIICFSIFFIKPRVDNKITLKTIKQKWALYDYSGVYETGKAYLEQHSYNNTALIYYGYACYFLSVSENDTFLAQEYLDESINSLRLALYDAKPRTVPQIQYMLGRAYFSKNTSSTYYYADLAVKYLTLAKNNNYEAKDISEYLGYSYAYLGMPMESISAFSDALLTRESDALLYAIAEQYFKCKEYSAAEQYLDRIIKNSSDDDEILKSRILTANIYLEKGNYETALKEFESILEKYPSAADAYYGIGVVYEKQGNLVKARAEWRKTLKIQVNHAGAFKKISEY